jgi:hypothetical protein
VVATFHALSRRIAPLPLRISEARLVCRFIAEWRSPDFHQLLLPFALAILTLASLGLFKRRHDVFVPLLVSLTFRPCRPHEIKPSLLVFMIVFAALKEGKSLRETLEPSGPKIALHITILTLLSRPHRRVDCQPAIHSCTIGQDRLSLHYPSEGADFIHKNYPQARILNEYAWGGYLIEELYPQKVFVDGRADFYGRKILNETADVIWANQLAGNPR